MVFWQRHTLLLKFISFLKRKEKKNKLATLVQLTQGPDFGVSRPYYHEKKLNFQFCTYGSTTPEQKKLLCTKTSRSITQRLEVNFLAFFLYS